MLYIFDKDGTICRSKSGKTFINSIEDQELIPGIKEKIDQLMTQGHLISIASNQGGVAFGYMTWLEAWSIVEYAANLIGAFHFEMCPFHPDGTIKSLAREGCGRKPHPGMILAIIDLLQEKGKVEKVTYVGDRQEDKGALENAQKARPEIDFEFCWAKDFFER